MSRFAKKLTSARIAPARPAFAHENAGPYTCPELRPNTTRPGSLVAHALASRMGSTLHWPNRSVTLMDGTPIAADQA